MRAVFCALMDVDVALIAEVGHGPRTLTALCLCGGPAGTRSLDRWSTRVVATKREADGSCVYSRCVGAGNVLSMRLNGTMCRFKLRETNKRGRSLPRLHVCCACVKSPEQKAASSLI